MSREDEHVRIELAALRTALEFVRADIQHAQQFEADPAHTIDREKRMRDRFSKEEVERWVPQSVERSLGVLTGYGDQVREWLNQIEQALALPGPIDVNDPATTVDYKGIRRVLKRALIRDGLYYGWLCGAAGERHAMVLPETKPRLEARLYAYSRAIHYQPWQAYFQLNIHTLFMPSPDDY